MNIHTCGYNRTLFRQDVEKGDDYFIYIIYFGHQFRFKYIK